MAVEHYNLFNNSGGWVQEFSDFSSEVTQETCFFQKHLIPEKPQQIIMSSNKYHFNGKKTIREVKTTLSLSDMTLIQELHDVDQDAMVPVFKAPLHLTDLTGQITPTLEVLSSLETIGPGGPLGLLGGTLPTAEVVNSVLTNGEDPCLGSSNLHDMDVNETFQDLSDLLEKDSCVLSPTCSTIDSEYSPASLHSSISSPAHFFAEELNTKSKKQTINVNNEELFVFSSPSTSRFSSLCQIQMEDSKDNRYVEMRKKNNIASKRSRQTRREREIENEQRVKELEDDNECLRAKVKKLEEMTDAVKKYLIQSVVRKR